MAATYKLISSTTLSSTTTSINLTSIPQTYTDIVVQGYLSQTGSGSNWDGCTIRVNSNTGSLYGTNFMKSDGSTQSTGSTGTTDAWYFDILTPGGGWPNPMAGFELYIPQYTSTSDQKVARLMGGGAMNARNGINFYSLVVGTTAAITSINFIYQSPATGFSSGSNIRLYGITAGN